MMDHLESFSLVAVVDSSGDQLCLLPDSAPADFVSEEKTQLFQERQSLPVCTTLFSFRGYHEA